MEACLDAFSEQAKVEELMRESCGCKLGLHGIACFSVLSKEVIIMTRNNCLQMASNELDLVALAQINTLRTPAALRSPASHDQGDFRPHAHMKVFLHGIQVYQKVLLFVHAISRTHFKNLSFPLAIMVFFIEGMEILGKGPTMPFHFQALRMPPISSSTHLTRMDYHCQPVFQPARRKLLFYLLIC